MKLKCFPVMIVTLLSFLLTPAQQRDLQNLSALSDKGNLRGVFSFPVVEFSSSKTKTRLFVAAWYDKGRESPTGRSSLMVFEKDESQYREVFSFEIDESLDFREFGTLYSLVLPGFTVKFSDNLDGDGPVWVVALVQEKFQIVYQGESSEIVDLDGNGIPEIFESVWPDGDGYPTSTTIHVWNGTRYQKLITSNWQFRFRKSVFDRIAKYNKTRKIR